VIPTEQIASPASTPSRDGLFAALRTLLHGGGSGAPSGRRAAMASLCALTAALALSTAPAQAARGHVFKEHFGSEGPGPGQFKEPTGLAVNEATHNLYVLDAANNRVEVVNPAGAFQGEITGPFAIGKGTLASGSNLITGVETESGAFTAGEELKAPGLEAETKIVAVKAGGVLEVSKVAIKTETTEPGALTAHQRFNLQFATVAVDNSCTLRKLGEEACAAEDPSNGDIYVANGEFESMVIDKFSSAGVYLGQISENSRGEHFGTIRGVAVDSSGILWVASNRGGGLEGFEHFSDAEVNVRLAPPFVQAGFSGSETFQFGIAVDSEDALYALTGSQPPAVKFNPAAKLVNEALPQTGTLDNETEVSQWGVATEQTTNDVYLDNISLVKRFAADGTFVEAFGEGSLTGGAGHLTGGTGVAVDASASSGEVFVSERGSDVVVAFGLAPAAAPLVATESVDRVSSEGATLSAELEPRSLPGEPETTYRFEYGACTSLSACSARLSTPSASLAPTFEVDPVSALVSGLAAGTVYHYRVRVENKFSKAEEKPVYGPEQTFTTPGNGEFALPDGRQWELVSPPDKHGAVIKPIGENETIQAAAGGGAIGYATNRPTESEPAGYTLATSVFSTRGADGWVSRDIAPPHTLATALGGNEVRFFSEDLTQAVVQPAGLFTPCTSAQGVKQPCLSEEASEQTSFLHSDYASGGSGEPCSEHCYTPLVTAQNATSGERFGREEPNKCSPGQDKCGPQFVGATRDLSHIVLNSHVPLTPGGGAGLYEWSAGKAAGEQLQPLLSGEAELGNNASQYEGGDARNAISADGTRVFYEASAGGPLSMRDLATRKTLRVDLPEGEPGCPAQDECGHGLEDAEFQGAALDGTRVLFTDTQKLTADGGAYAEARTLGVNTAGGDLYECAVGEVAGEPTCTLKDLAPVGGVLGSVPGVSEDASWVYFVANGVLENNGVPIQGAVAGTCEDRGDTHFNHSCNLYVRHDGTTKLVAVLSGEDYPDWKEKVLHMTARVSPDGHWFAFMSSRSLTGYDNRDAVSGKRDEEVYLYDGATGRLLCASCNPTGARPHGVLFGHNPLAGVGPDTSDWAPNVEFAGSVPTWTSNGSDTAIYQSRYLSNSGRLFFDSSDGLVPKDVNGTGDVYEYEPQGVPVGEHACSSTSQSGSEVFRPARLFKAEVAGEKFEGEEGAGCLALISSGSSDQESAFLDASQSGGDVFFLTTSKLAPQDSDTALDVYDAHECTTESPCLPVPAPAPPPCNTEASCKAAPSPQPQIFGLSGSATFSGLGNIAPPPPVVKKKTVKCKKGFTKKHNKCVRKRKTRAKRSAHTNRRAKS
jgi:hypothetical protein